VRNIRQRVKAAQRTLDKFKEVPYKWGLPRIAPAAALPGDLVQMPGDDTIGAMTIYVGNGRVLGYHEAVEGAVVMQPVEMVAAWRAA
jgi:cell wall-associated NlpC family hydrolase